MRKVVSAFAAIAFLAFLVWLGLHNRESGNQYGRNSGPPDVTTITATSRQVPVEVKLPGRTSAYRMAQIRPQVNGIIVKRLFTEGSDVTEGQHLYQLDPAVYQAAMSSADANLEHARASARVAELKYKRYKELLGTRAISQQDYDDADAALQQANAQVLVAQAAVATAKLNLSYTRVYAPIAGRIGKSLVTEGALVTAGQSQPLAVVTQLDPIYVDIEQSSAENAKLRSRLAGQDHVGVTIVASGASPFPHEGTLEFSDVSVDESTGSVELRALFPNPEHALLPGTFVNATLHLGSETAIVVPQQVVGRDAEGKAQVWVVGDDDTVHQQQITTERAVGDEWVVIDGLKAGDVLVIEGVQRLSPGIKVVPHAQVAPGAP